MCDWILFMPHSHPLIAVADVAEYFQRLRCILSTRNSARFSSSMFNPLTAGAAYLRVFIFSRALLYCCGCLD